MNINSNWRDVVKTINGTIGTVGLNTGEGLGMKYSNAVLGPQKWAGAACWDAGNSTIVVNSDEENMSTIELCLGDERDDVVAMRAWDRLQASLSKTGAAQVGAVTLPIKEPPKPPEPRKNGGTFNNAWFDWYHAMKDAGYNCTLQDVAEKSRYDHGYVKQLHAAYVKERTTN